MSAAANGEIPVLKVGDEVLYLERGSWGGPTSYKATVVVAHARPFTPPVLDLVCIDSRGRTFARTRVPHESAPGAPACWKTC